MRQWILIQTIIILCLLRELIHKVFPSRYLKAEFVNEMAKVVVRVLEVRYEFVHVGFIEHE